MPAPAPVFLSELSFLLGAPLAWSLLCTSFVFALLAVVRGTGLARLIVALVLTGLTFTRAFFVAFACATMVDMLTLPFRVGTFAALGFGGVGFRATSFAFVVRFRGLAFTWGAVVCLGRVDGGKGIFGLGAFAVFFAVFFAGGVALALGVALDATVALGVALGVGVPSVVDDTVGDCEGVAPLGSGVCGGVETVLVGGLSSPGLDASVALGVVVLVGVGASSLDAVAMGGVGARRKCAVGVSSLFEIGGVGVEGEIGGVGVEGAASHDASASTTPIAAALVPACSLATTAAACSLAATAAVACAFARASNASNASAFSLRLRASVPSLNSSSRPEVWRNNWRNTGAMPSSGWGDTSTHRPCPYRPDTMAGLFRMAGVYRPRLPLSSMSPKVASVSTSFPAFISGPLLYRQVVPPTWSGPRTAAASPVNVMGQFGCQPRAHSLIHGSSTSRRPRPQVVPQ